MCAFVSNASCALGQGIHTVPATCVYLCFTIVYFLNIVHIVMIDTGGQDHLRAAYGPGVEAP